MAGGIRWAPSNLTATIANVSEPAARYGTRVCLSDHAAAAARHRCGMEWPGGVLPSAMTRPRHESLTFVTSGGDRLAGVLYLPAQPPVAAVVTTGPLTSVKEQATGSYALALAE